MDKDQYIPMKERKKERKRETPLYGTLFVVAAFMMNVSIFSKIGKQNALSTTTHIDNKVFVFDLMVNGRFLLTDHQNLKGGAL
jgi:hypothetical protein